MSTPAAPAPTASSTSVTSVVTPGGASPAAPTSSGTSIATAVPSEPTKTLAQKLQESKGRAKTATTGPTTSEGSPKVVPSNPSTDSSGQGAKTGDPDFAAVEKILREDQRVKDERKKVDADKAAWETQKAAERAELEAARAAKTAIKSGDVPGALKALGLTDADLYEGDNSVVFRLAESRTKKPQLDEKARLEQVVAAKLAEKDAEAKAAADAKKKADEDKAAADRATTETTIAGAKVAYAKNAVAIVAAEPTKYPHLVAFKVTAREVVEHAWEVLRKSEGKTLLSEADALEAVEKDYKEKAERSRGTATPAVVVPPARPGPNPGIQASNGSAAAPATAGKLGLADSLKAAKERARKASEKTA